jgi:hypothetical protein
MTMLAEHETVVASEPAARPRSRRPLFIAAGVAVLLATAAGVGLFLTGGSPTTAAHQPLPGVPITPGHALHAVAVYERVGQPSTSGERTFPSMGRPGVNALVLAKPVTHLRTQFAHIVSNNGSTQVSFFAPRSSVLQAGHFYVAVVDGQALTLFFVHGSDDGTNFAVGAGPNRITDGQAQALANYMTSKVVTSSR